LTVLDRPRAWVVAAVALLGACGGGARDCAPGERCAEGGGAAEVRTAPPGMALVPGGSFRMGSDTGFPDEAPVHRVRVRPFFLDVHEVTVAQYRRCSDAGRCTPLGTRVAWPELFPNEREAWNQYCNANVPGREQHPANCAEWSQADAYCRAQGWRLPTEEEFEYAARGGDEERTFPWGEAPPDETRLNACGPECSPLIGAIRGGWIALYPRPDGWPGTAPVGSFPAGRGRWGHHDLSGNVWEWTSDLYCPYESPGCFSDERIVRGSGFLQTNLVKTRATRRNQDTEWHVSGDLGFRCATSLGRNPRPGASAPSFTLMHQRPGTARWDALFVLTLLLLVAIGAIFGLLGGGGSVLTLPIMLLVVGLVPLTASAMSVVVLAATAPVSALSHARRGNVRLGLGLLFGAMGAGGAFLGGRLARVSPPPLLFAGFVLVMLVTAHAMLRRRRAPASPAGAAAPAPTLRSRALLALCGGGVGFVSGLLGVGGGFLIVPALTLVGRLPMAAAVGTSAVVITMNSLSSAAGQRAHTLVDWQLVVAFSLASAAGSLLGSRLTHRVSPDRLRRWFGVLVLVAGTLVLTRQALPGIRDLLRSRSQVAPAQRGDRG
jgi:formylglycine-generating enzyme required for sulfatase activity/uncharacterized membrane protein YfcA